MNPFDLNFIELIVTIIVGILTGLAILFGGIGKVWRWLFDQLPRLRHTGKTEFPRKTIRIVPHIFPNALTWKLGGHKGESCMVIRGHFRITSITNRRIGILGMTVIKPKLAKGNVAGFPFEGAIAPYVTEDISLECRIMPPILEAGKPFMANIAVIDDHNNEHILRKLTFKSSDTILPPMKKLNPRMKLRSIRKGFFINLAKWDKTDKRRDSGLIRLIRLIRCE